jgi:pullulanase
VQNRAAREAAFENFKELLAIRKSSPLFRLRTQAQIDQRLEFHNTGPFQIPGVVALSIEGCTEPGFTPPEGAVMIVVNASDDPRTLALFTDQAWTLHPVQQASVDSVVRTARHDANGFFVPARTTAVFRRASQTSCAPYPRDLFVRGGFNSWAADPAFKLGFLGGTDYSVSAPVSPAGNYEFKIADEGWTTGTNCGAGPAGDVVRLGIGLTLDCVTGGSGPPNLKLAAPTAGNYTFALAAADTANPVLTVTKTPPSPLTLYVRGGFTDWGTSLPLVWDGVDTYRATGTITAAQTGAEQQFKIADADWGGTNGGATNCGANATTDVVTVGQPYALVCGPNPPNLKVTFASEGAYLFAVDATNPAALQLTVEKAPFGVPVFVRGIGGDWSDGAQNQMTYKGGGLYSINKQVAAAAGEFKIASSDWLTVNCGGGAGGNAVTVGTPLALECGANPPNLSIAPAAAGTYIFNYQVESATGGQLTVTGP